MKDRTIWRIVSVVGLVIMLLAMFKIEDTNTSLLVSCPFALVAGLSIDSWWKKY